MTRPRGQVTPNSARLTALGWLVGDVVLTAIATVFGAARGRSWVGFIAGVGVVTAAGFYVKIRHRFELDGTGAGSEAFADWWRRAILVMVATGIPCWVAIGVAVAAHK